MRQAFIMAEGGLEAIGSEPDGNSNAKWMFPEQETRDMAARIFGTGFDAQVQYGTSVYTRRKYTVIRGSNSRETICINYSLKKITDTFGWIVEAFKNDNDEPKDIPPPRQEPADDMRNRLGEGDIVCRSHLRWNISS